jgi:hypothetical protein
VAYTVATFRDNDPQPYEVERRETWIDSMEWLEGRLEEFKELERGGWVTIHNSSTTGYTDITLVVRHNIGDQGELIVYLVTLETNAYPT